MKKIINDNNIRVFIKSYLDGNPYKYPPLNTWDVSNVTDMSKLFVSSKFNEPLNEWNVSNVINMEYMFSLAPNFNQPLDKWNVSNVTNMRYMFYKTSTFNQPLDKWIMSSVTNTERMFSYATNFNQNIDNWDVSNVTNMEEMFFSALAFNQPSLNSWNVSKVTVMTKLFADLPNFNSNISEWNVSSVINMNGMFSKCYKFNQPLHNWNVSNVTNMSSLFLDAHAFNQSIDNWNTFNVSDMSYMFSNAFSFNQPLNNWNVSNVITMENMFTNNNIFNQPLNNWDVSNVTNMRNMFEDNFSFNQPLNNWNVFNVKYMEKMFFNCINFNQDISNWVINQQVIVTNMFINSDIDEFFKPKGIHPDNIKDESIKNTLYYNSYESYPEKQDPLFVKFQKSMREATSGKSQTVISKHNFIPDTLLDNRLNDNYIIHYEIFDNKSYPVISILKGTILFTSRKDISKNQFTSFNYLYKLLNHSTLENYSKNDFQNVLTYFFPFPLMCHAVSSNFKNMDAVILTQDIKLLCLISPSPMIRANRNNMCSIQTNTTPKTCYNKSYIKTCSSRKYDLCMSDAIIKGLKLNGYIGIAEQDSLSRNYKVFENMIGTNELINSNFFKSCTFNNKFSNEITFPTSFDKYATDTRVYGIPEVSLIPYNIHDYNQTDYDNIYQRFSTNLNNNNPLMPLDWQKFIFKPFINEVGANTIDVSNKIYYNLSATPNVNKSLQAYPLFNVYTPDMDPSLRDKYSFDFRTGREPEQIMFMDTYNDSRKPSDVNAFEMMRMYSKRNEWVGGKIEQDIERKIINSNPQKNIYNIKQNIFTLNDQKQNNYIDKDNETFYFKEINGIPIVAFQLYKSDINGGINRKRKTLKYRKSKKSKKHKISYKTLTKRRKI